MTGYSTIGLDNPKYSINVGQVLRLAGNFGVKNVFYSGRRYKDSPSDTSKAYRALPLIQANDLRLVIPYDCVPVGVELVPGARSLHDYVHPARAFYIFGAEDATLGQRVLSWCRDVVYIPTTYCMNLASCVATVLYDRQLKLSQRQTKPLP